MDYKSKEARGRRYSDWTFKIKEVNPGIAIIQEATILAENVLLSIKNQLFELLLKEK